jgi:two-component system, NarL family, sensor histidine kinase UhpB
MKMGWGLLRIVAVSLWLGWGAQALAQGLALARAEVAFDPAHGAAAAAWQEVPLPHDWEKTFPGRSGTAVYRLAFDAPADAGLQAVYLQRACTNVEVFLNGELVGSGGNMAPPVTRNCYYPQLFALPRPLLRPQGNELRIHLAGFAAASVSARQRAAGLSEVRVGPISELKPLYDRQLFWNVTVAQIIAALIGALGAGLLGLSAVRRQDRYLFYFGLFAAGWALISARLFVQEVPISNLATEILICSAFPPVLACAYLFLMRLIEARFRWVDALLWLQALVVPFALALAGPVHLLRAASAVYNLVAIEFLLVVAWFFRRAWRSHRQEFWLMSGVLLMAVSLAGMEIALQNDLLPLPKIHVIHFAMPFLFLVIGARLIQMFVRALRHAESLNLELERRVEEKSREIERSWEQLTRLRAEQAAQSERQRIAADLHDDLGAKLLTIAQAGGSDKVARMARQAMDEMRLSVRGLTGEAAQAAEVLADWRAECVTRLYGAGIEPAWHAGDAPQGLVIPARTHVQLTRVLREAVSNVIRHSGARSCAVTIAFGDGRIAIEVRDDGRGLARRAGDEGHGLPGIERRIRKLGGEHRIDSPPGQGTRLAATVPLAGQSATIDRP